MFRFTIRELVLLTLVVAMGVGWWLDRYRQATTYSHLSRAYGIVTAHLAQLGWKAELDSEGVTLSRQYDGGIEFMQRAPFLEVPPAREDTSEPVAGDSPL